MIERNKKAYNDYIMCQYVRQSKKNCNKTTFP